jgi:D-glycero-D-manno-heptose 1,7-bisphosphate phosphatase
MNKALFLDRDGVINVNHGYVYQTSDFDFIDGIFDLVQRANEQSYKVIVVTNQSGIGRGMYTEADFEALSAWMLCEFAKRGTIIDDVLFCPHHPQAKLQEYKKVCECRKPKAGMLKVAASKHNICLANSMMVGDKLSDVEAAIAAGLREVVWFNPEFIEPMQTSTAEFQAKSLSCELTSLSISHSLGAIITP